MNPEALEKYRKQKGLTAAELAQRIGKSPAWYSKVRHGKHMLSSRHIIALSEVFGIRPEELAREYFSEPELEDASSDSA